MKIKLAKNIGFCNGVEKSIDKATELLKENSHLYALGQLVHNKEVIKQLKCKGLVEIEELPNHPCKVIIRAHGVSKEIYMLAKEKNIELIDLTCPKVLAIHKLAQKLAADNYYIILTGKKTHPEIIGTISYCGQNSIIIEKEEDLKNLKPTTDKLALLSQTTYNLEKFDNIKKRLQNAYPNIEIYNTICYATKTRQEEIQKLASQTDAVLVIGDKKSSNTNKLFELSKKNNHNTFFIEQIEDLNLEELNKFVEIAITTGASTPKEKALDIVKVLKR